ncbi:MAG: CBS domain-containing protein [Candidatus Electrothrix sp. EH2]|nr:CBS domain-containing protein [Candidatus Electrothrix sp. EH2]
MSEKSKDIREMVIPLDRCLRLYEDQALNDAIKLFSHPSSEEYPVDLPVLLVLDRQDTLVGSLSRIDILRGLVPNMLGRSRSNSFAWNATEYPHLTYLYEDHVLAECGGNRTRQVRFLMRPVDFTLPADTHILEAIIALHKQHSSCVPVSENGAIIGLLRFEELFHAMCNTWCMLPES